MTKFSLLTTIGFAAIFSFKSVHVQAQELTGYQNETVAQRVPSGDHQASAVALQATLYELIDQYHAVQQGHWNVTGPLFYGMHDLLGHFYRDLATTIDPLAERISALDVAPNGNPSASERAANLKTFPEGFVSDKKCIDILTERYHNMSIRLGERILEIGDDDLVSQDVLIGIKDMVDDHLWKLRMFAK